MHASFFTGPLLSGLFISCHAHPNDPHKYIPPTESDSKPADSTVLKTNGLKLSQVALHARVSTPWPTRVTSPVMAATSTRFSSQRP